MSCALNRIFAVKLAETRQRNVNPGDSVGLPNRVDACRIFRCVGLAQLSFAQLFRFGYAAYPFVYDGVFCPVENWAE